MSLEDYTTIGGLLFVIVALVLWLCDELRKILLLAIKNQTVLTKSKSQLIVKQQLEIESLKEEILEMSISIKDARNEANYVQQWNHKAEEFPKVAMLAAIKIVEVLR